MTTKLFRLKISGEGTTPGETTLIRVDAADAYVLRNQVWTARRRPGGGLMVSRHIGTGRTLMLARHLMDCPPGKFVRHLNGDSHDFTRANLVVRDDMCDDGISCRRGKPALERAAA